MNVCLTFLHTGLAFKIGSELGESHSARIVCELGTNGWDIYAKLSEMMTKNFR